MKEKSIIVKERSSGLFAKGFAVLILMLVSLLCALLPLLVADIKDIASYFYIAGGALFVLFTAMFIALLYRECNPKDALILTAHGFTDIKNIGTEIEWTNVSDVKLINRRDNPLLGISLENTDIVLAKMKKKQANEMRDNIEENLPAVLIAQNDVRISIEELKKNFTKLARDARVLEQAPKSKPKTNPFSTDDVLRAFGKLPKENEDAPAEAEETEAGIAEVKKESVNTTIVSEERKTTNDSFYDSLYKSEPQNEVPQKSSDEDNRDSEYMPPEIQELLDRAKSTKISEIEKILVDPDNLIAEADGADINSEKTVQITASESDSAPEAGGLEENESGKVDSNPQEINTDNDTADVDSPENEQTSDNDSLNETLFNAEANTESGTDPETDAQIQQPESIPDCEIISIADDFAFIRFDEFDDTKNAKRPETTEADNELIIITDSDD